jgi:hypothetical protein
VKQSGSRPTCLVLAPSTATWEPRSVFVIHGRGDTAARFSKPWQPLVDEGWTLIVAPAGYSWDDRELARAEIRRHLEDCRSKRGLGTDGMVIAGAGEGGELALEMAHEAGVPWLSVIPSFSTGYDAGPLMAVPSHTRGAFLLGEHDPANSRALPVIAMMQSAGVQLIVRTMKGVGHDLPDDFSAHAREALRALQVYG